jgi:pimeloyl-ACP methyl ester carboxylesterase
MGGWAVVGFALSHSDRVASLVIADSTGGIVDDEVMNILVTAERRTVDTTQLGSHPAIGDELTNNDRAKAFLYTQIGGFRGDVEDAEMIGKLMSTRYPLPEVAKLRMPSLAVVGSDDDLIPPAAVARVASILGADLVEIEGAGHSPYFERPDEWNREVLGFVNGVASS